MDKMREYIDVLEDLLLSCKNHKRGTDKKDILELNRFDNRIRTLEYVIRLLKSPDKPAEGSEYCQCENTPDFYKAIGSCPVCNKPTQPKPSDGGEKDYYIDVRLEPYNG